MFIYHKNSRDIGSKPSNIRFTIYHRKFKDLINVNLLYNILLASVGPTDKPFPLFLDFFFYQNLVTIKVLKKKALTVENFIVININPFLFKPKWNSWKRRHRVSHMHFIKWFVLHIILWFSVKNPFEYSMAIDNFLQNGVRHVAIPPQHYSVGGGCAHVHHRFHRKSK